MKKLFIIVLFSFSAMYVKGQVNTIDSLRQSLRSKSADTDKIFTLLRIGVEYYYSNPDSAMYYAQQGLRISEKANYILGKIQSSGVMANLLYEKGSYIDALQVQFKIIDLQEERRDTLGVASTCNNIGRIYDAEKDYRNAIIYYSRAMDIYKSTKTLDYVLITQLNIGLAYERINRLDSALFYQQKAYQLAVDLKDQDNMGAILTNLGTIYYKQHKNDTALHYFERSLPYAIKIDDKQTIADAKYGIAQILEARGFTDSALIFAKQSFQVAVEAVFPENIVKASALLSSLYEQQHKIDSAYYYYKKSVTTRDTLFNAENIRRIQQMNFDEQLRKKELKDNAERYANRLRFTVSSIAVVFFLIMALVLYRNNRQKQKVNTLLETKNEQIEHTLRDLKLAQAQLIQSEKMASLGELTVGIAHEIQNPLNFVNNFSDLNGELIDELKEEAQKGNMDDVLAIADDIKANEGKINHHGKRAESIVKAMLDHSRGSSNVKELADINKLCDEYLKLSYHGLKAKDDALNVTMLTDFDMSIEKMELIPQEIGRVLLNLYNNAFYAVQEKYIKIKPPELTSPEYVPTVEVYTKKLDNKVEIRVKDNGNGIPDKIVNKIFQPFFTTKPTGQAIGLGLSLSYDIVTAHGGEIKVETKEGEGSTFIILLPYSNHN